MRARILTTAAVALLAAGPAAAADKPFFSLANTDFVVLIGFLVFVGILLYFKAPSKIGALLDARAVAIKAELDEARALREDAQALLASFERKQHEVAEQANRIVAQAREEAERAAAEARDEIRRSVARRLTSAEEQIAAAQAAAIKDVRDRAVQVAVAAAGQVLAGQMTAEQGNRLIDDAIGTVQAKLH